jgi:hypothetical protein
VVGKNKDKGKGDKHGITQADLDCLIEEQGGEKVKGRKHTFDMKKEVDKEKAKKNK